MRGSNGGARSKNDDLFGGLATVGGHIDTGDMLRTQYIDFQGFQKLVRPDNQRNSRVRAYVQDAVFNRDVAL